MVHDFVLKDGEFSIISDIKWNIVLRLFELRCDLSLLASFFFQWLEVETFCRLNSGSLFCKKVCLLISC